jgi:pimeloyl-ACP methyl ester carboxylesterase
MKRSAPADGESEWADRMFLEALDEAWAQGPGGIIDDYLALTRLWGFDVADVAVPTWIMVARDDEEIPVSHGRWLAGAIPGAAFVEMPGGHFDDQRDEEQSMMAWLATGDDPNSS